MSTQITLSAFQKAAGQPIRVAVQTVEQAADVDYTKIALGTTATSTPPATVADFAHTIEDGDLYGNAWNSLLESQTTSVRNGSKLRDRHTYSASKLQIQLTGGVAAGQYLWAVTDGGAHPAVSNGYHIQ